MKNYYKVLQIPRISTNKDIKNKTKELLQIIKKSDITKSEKIKLSMKVYESYKFLNDYHNRKSLDDYLDNNIDSQYKIINNDKLDSQYKIINNHNDTIFDNLGLKLLGSLSIPFNELENEFKNMNIQPSKSYFYSRSTLNKSEYDKYGNVVYKTREYINDNGKKDTIEY